MPSVQSKSEQQQQQQRGRSQRYIGIVSKDLRHEFSYDRTQARELWNRKQLTPEQCLEITYDMAQILCQSAIGQPVHLHHANQSDPNNLGQIRRMWIDQNKLMVELEIWNDLLNQDIARGMYLNLSLTHQMDWDHFINHIVSECSLCIKGQRPDSCILSYHKGKPGEVEIEGDEWILFDQDDGTPTIINPDIDKSDHIEHSTLS